jgi:hypothetical protein
MAVNVKVCETATHQSNKYFSIYKLYLSGRRDVLAFYIQTASITYILILFVSNETNVSNLVAPYYSEEHKTYNFIQFFVRFRIKYAFITLNHFTMLNISSNGKKQQSAFPDH